MLKKFIIRTLLGATLFAILLATMSIWLYQIGLNHPLKLQGNSVDYRVRNGMSLRQVAKELAEQNIMSYPIALTWLAAGIVEKKSHRIKAGEYHILPTTSARELLELMIAGKSLQNHIRLLEGWAFKRMLKTVLKHPKLIHELNGLSQKAIMEKLGYAGIHPEGRFFPDTYYFESDTTDTALLQRAYERMNLELKDIWAKKADNLPLENAYEALILASIIEKETGAAVERAQIAGAFIRRLNKGMRLQTDPTVIYGMGDKYNGDIRKSDLREKTAYNTYVINGLPPTPISMPSREALFAAVHPDDGDALFFVAKGGGRHYFSSNYKEHQCAVLRYQIKTKAPHLLVDRCKSKPHCRVCQEK